MPYKFYKSGKASPLSEMSSFYSGVSVVTCYPFGHVYLDIIFPSSVNVVCIYFCGFACIHDRRQNVHLERFLFSWVQHLIFKHLAPWPLLSILFRCVRCCFLSVSWNESRLKKKKYQ